MILFLLFSWVTVNCVWILGLRALIWNYKTDSMTQCGWWNILNAQDSWCLMTWLLSRYCVVRLFERCLSLGSWKDKHWQLHVHTVTCSSSCFVFVILESVSALFSSNLQHIWSLRQDVPQGFISYGKNYWLLLGLSCNLKLRTEKKKKKRGSVTYSTDWEDEVSKIFIVSPLFVWGFQFRRNFWPSKGKRVNLKSLLRGLSGVQFREQSRG